MTTSQVFFSFEGPGSMERKVQSLLKKFSATLKETANVSSEKKNLFEGKQQSLILNLGLYSSFILFSWYSDTREQKSTMWKIKN